MINPKIFLLAGAMVFAVGRYFYNKVAPMPEKYSFNIDYFRTKPINLKGDGGEFLGIDRVSYLLYKKEAQALIDQLNKRPFSVYGIPETDSTMREIKELIKKLEYFENNYSYKALNNE